MSRIGKQLINIPDLVSVEQRDSRCYVNGPKGNLSQLLPNEINLDIEDKKITVNRKDDSDFARSQHGLMRTLIANMIEGVTTGYNVKLEIQGVGYRAVLQGEELVLSLGFSHPVKVKASEGVKFGLEKNIISVTGIDKALVGEAAAKIRALKKPEPYKGKGIRYLGETVLRKAGKTTKA